MYAVASRNKTDGRYKCPPMVDETVKVYGNKVDGYFDTMEEVDKHIKQKGQMYRLYSVNIKSNNPVSIPRMAGNGWIVHMRYVYTRGSWFQIHPISPAPIR